jgi:hypothetical protein
VFCFFLILIIQTEGKNNLYADIIAFYRLFSFLSFSHFHFVVTLKEKKRTFIDSDFETSGLHSEICVAFVKQFRYSSCFLDKKLALPAPKLNMELYTDINKLKLLTPTSTPTRFKLLKSTFDDDDEDEGAAATPKEIIITGQIFPNSEIFNQGSYKIEMKLPSSYPFEPPEVRFVTPIYHPNVDKEGKRKNEKN